LAQCAILTLISSEFKLTQRGFGVPKELLNEIRRVGRALVRYHRAGVFYVEYLLSAVMSNCKYFSGTLTETSLHVARVKQ